MKWARANLGISARFEIPRKRRQPESLTRVNLTSGAVHCMHSSSYVSNWFLSLLLFCEENGDMPEGKWIGHFLEFSRSGYPHFSASCCDRFLTRRRGFTAAWSKEALFSKTLRTSKGIYFHYTVIVAVYCGKIWSRIFLNGLLFLLDAGKN